MNKNQKRRTAQSNYDQRRRQGRFDQDYVTEGSYGYDERNQGRNYDDDFESSQEYRDWGVRNYDQDFDEGRRYSRRWEGSPYGRSEWRESERYGDRYGDQSSGNIFRQPEHRRGNIGYYGQYRSSGERYLGDLGTNYERGGYGGSQSSDESYGWGGSRMKENLYGESTFRGKGPKGYKRSDERIKEEVNDMLTDEGALDATEIEVQVQNGDVTLTGSVTKKRDKRLAEEIAESVSGVSNVENHLRVSKESSESEKGTLRESLTDYSKKRQKNESFN